MRISACVIMRDAAEDIAECLESLADGVDEFIVVDTGSADASEEIAARYAGSIHHFAWRDDFSAAKNYAIDRATGDWIVFLDADEMLTEETRGNLRTVLSRYASDAADGTPDTFEILRYNIRTDTQETVSENYAERIFCRHPLLRFRDTIHEYLEFADGRERHVLRLAPEELAIRHKGYSPERMEEKTERNLRMLEELRTKGVEKKWLYHYLTGLYLHEKEYQKAAEMAWESVERGEVPEGDTFRPYVLLLQAVELAGDEEEFLRALRCTMERHPLRPEAFALYGGHMQAKGELKEAKRCLVKAIRNEKNFGRNFPGGESALAPQMPEVYRCLADVMDALGNAAEARRYRRRSESGMEKER